MLKLNVSLGTLSPRQIELLQFSNTEADPPNAHCSGAPEAGWAEAARTEAAGGEVTCDAATVPPSSMTNATPRLARTTARLRNGEMLWVMLIGAIMPRTG